MTERDALNEDFQDFLRCLLAARVEFVIVGAHALAWHGIPRATGDLDVLVHSRDHRRARDLLMSRSGYELRDDWGWECHLVDRTGMVLVDLHRHIGPDVRPGTLWFDGLWHRREHAASAGGIPTLHAASLHGYGAPRKLFVQRMPHIALSDTSSGSHFVTDSAAGMTAIVTGRKINNNMVSQSTSGERGVRDGEPLKTILEYAEERGLSTGIITNDAATGATHDDLRLMRANTPPHMQVKAAGGVRSLDALLEVMALGVTRVGATVTQAMLEDFKTRKAGG